MDHSMAWRWMKANVIAAVIAAIVALAVYGMRQVLGPTDAGAIAVAVHCALAAVLFGISGAAWGVLTGAVLQRIIPMLPAWNWVALHAALSISVGVGGELSGALTPAVTSEVPASQDLPQDLSIQARVASGLVFGALVGAFVGALEAMVLRQAARGAAAWILWSAASFAAVMALFFGSEGLRQSDGGWGGELLFQMFSLGGATIIALMLLPALSVLRPRAMA
jgi:hypothetical protein